MIINLFFMFNLYNANNNDFNHEVGDHLLMSLKILSTVFHKWV
jgi:hypothetical protein